MARTAIIRKPLRLPVVVPPAACRNQAQVLTEVSLTVPLLLLLLLPPAEQLRPEPCCSGGEGQQVKTG